MKIDTSTIEGYANMTPEEKLSALEAFEYNDNSDEVARQKQAVTNATKEAADYKRQLKELQEKAGKGTSDYETLKADFEAYKAQAEKEKNIASYTAQYLAQGYSAELAAETAKALADGDTDKVFANQKQFLEEREKQIKAELLKGTPAPDKGGKPPEPMSKEKFKQMSFQERMQYAAQHPEEYKKIYNGG